MLFNTLIFFKQRIQHLNVCSLICNNNRLPLAIFIFPAPLMKIADFFFWWWWWGNMGWTDRWTAVFSCILFSFADESSTNFISSAVEEVKQIHLDFFFKSYIYILAFLP